MNLKRELRKVHGDGGTGHLEVCFDEKGRHMATCGFDGEVKVFNGYDDKDPSSFLIGEVVYAIAVKGGRLYVAGDDNSIQSFILADSSLDGILLRFTSHVNHFCFNKKGDNDFMLKMLDLTTKSQTDFKGHEAPVLSVTIHPSDDDVIASSSCDGTVKVWKSSEGKCLRTIKCLPKSNSFETSKTLARIAFTDDAKYLLVPGVDKILAYSAKEWTIAFELKADVENNQVSSWSLVSVGWFWPLVSVWSVLSGHWSVWDGFGLWSVCGQFQVVTGQCGVVLVTDQCVSFSTLSLSADGRYVASSRGQEGVSVWDVREKKMVKRGGEGGKQVVTSVCWHPTNHEVAFCNNQGYMGLLRNPVEVTEGSVIQDGGRSAGGTSASHAGRQTVGDLFGDDDDDADLLVAVANDADDDDADDHHHRQNNMGDDDDKKHDDGVDDDDDAGDGGIPGVDTDGEEEEEDDADEEGGVKKRKRMTNILVDEEASNRGHLTIAFTFVIIQANTAPTTDWPESLTDLPISSTEISTQQVGGDGSSSRKSWQPVDMQKPFIPTSCPKGLVSRFMVWNEIGRVQQYTNFEDESGERTINAEFHDSSIHHTIHIDNSTHNFNMAALNEEALLLASEAQEATASQLLCMHFSTWDTNKEWSMAMPDGESIVGMCLGERWLAVATNVRLVRVYSVGGVQKEVFSLTGPLVTMVGCLDLLAVIYHEAMGIPGDQCMSFMLLSTSKMRLLASGRLPLTSKSTVAWAGAIFCKGSKYPSTLPLPIVQILPFKLPYCEMNTDKSILEEQYWRTRLLSNHFKFWKVQGYHFDQSEESRMGTLMKELLMKLFALSCRSNKEVRAVELGEMMPDVKTLQLAIRYASQKGETMIVHKLNDLARSKVEKDNEDDDEDEKVVTANNNNNNDDDDDDDAMKMKMMRIMSKRMKEQRVSCEEKPLALKPAKILFGFFSLFFLINASSAGSKFKPSNEKDLTEVDDDEVDQGLDEDDADDDNQIEKNDSGDDEDEYDDGGAVENSDSEKEQVDAFKKPGTIAGKKRNKLSKKTSLSDSMTFKEIKNPFKVASNDIGSTTNNKPPQTQPRGSSIFDNMEKPKSSRVSAKLSSGNSEDRKENNAKNDSSTSLKKRKRNENSSPDHVTSVGGAKKLKEVNKSSTNQKLSSFFFNKNESQ
ncbi:hypothetical protein HELRODRAFT_193239 [Helobdella robusta]|uniref:Uncharacterized protein n=1 Tax=Helobdella robusta TaxID=6412 RepID=T1FUS2_HELRO|nr:hypothetical protein HELRODRAFT_193239 [Helobdella robusta]ESN97554.1 hypothetical protein HELRODRAFT_193239 [Helobdella robusta]